LWKRKPILEYFWILLRIDGEAINASPGGSLARAEGKKEKLHESDYLLGVFDKCRMGALRFKEDKSGPFLNDTKDFAVPHGLP